MNPETHQVFEGGPLPEHVQTVFFRGLNYGPGDCLELAQHLQTDIWVPENPLYRGVLPEGKKKLTVQETMDYELQVTEEIAKEFSKEHSIEEVYTHSRGALAALLTANAMDQSQITTMRIIFCNPPCAAEIPVDEEAAKIEPYNVMNPIYKPMTKGMDPEKYDALIKRHSPDFRNSLRHMNPRVHSFSPERTHDLMQSLREDIRIILILGKDDPWNDRSRMNQMVGKRPVTVVELPGGHFLLQEHPDHIATVVQSWRASISIPGRSAAVA